MGSALAHRFGLVASARTLSRGLAAAALALGLSGCSLIVSDNPNGTRPDGGQPGEDARPDAQEPSGFRPTFVDLDSVAPQSVTFVVGDTLDTGDGTFDGGGASIAHTILSGGSGEELFVVYADAPVLIANLKVRGPRPLVVYSRQSITVDGGLDVGSYRAEISGPGANSSLCGGSNGQDGADGAGASGGGLKTAGGQGGGSTLPGASPGTGALPGDAEPVLDILRGGCPGGIGSNLQTRAAGGGAVYLVSADSINLTGGFIAAGGSGGAGAPMQQSPSGGGAGGGSGGMIVLEAPTLNLNGFIGVKGGGGGGGSHDAGNGSNGAREDGESFGGFANMVAAAGGSGASTANSGRVGLFGDTIAGGGGGGGGGAIIMVSAPPDLESLTTSPPGALEVR